MMDKISNSNERLVIIVNKFLHLIMLNIEFLITCLPIITIGDALTSMYESIFSMRKNEEPYILKNYLKLFRTNFKFSTKAFLLILFAYTILYFDFFYLRNYAIHTRKVLWIIFTALTIVISMISSYIFPLMAKFEYDFKMYFINSLFLSMRHFVVTIPILLINLIPFFFVIVGSREMLIYGFTFYILIGFSLSAYLNSYLFDFVFNKYIQQIQSKETKYETKIEN